MGENLGVMGFLVWQLLERIKNTDKVIEVNHQIITVKMVEVLDEKVKDLLVPDSFINLREEENKSHMFGAVEIRISKLQEGN